MRFFLPIHRNGAFGTITQVEQKIPTKGDYHYDEYNPIVRVVTFLAKHAMDVSSMIYALPGYGKTLLAMKKKRPVIVAPPLLDIRSSSKSFPTARKVAYCAIKGLPYNGNPLVAEPAVEYEEEYEEEF